MSLRLPGRASLSVVVLALGCGPGHTQEAEADKPVGEQILEGLLSSFSLPLGDLLKKKHDSEFRNLLEGVSGSAGFSYPLQNRDLGNATQRGRQGEQPTLSPTLQLSLRYTPLGAWFVGGTAYEYLGEKETWQPDFSYSFGYDDYRPYTLSLVYSNYSANRFDPGSDESAFNFDEGSWSLGWKFPVPKMIADPMLIDRSASINCQVATDLTYHYYDEASQENRSWKNSLSLGCTYPIYEALSLNWTAFYYPKEAHQQPWDPDFTYVFGYSEPDYGRFSLQYSNYSGNRYPWRNPEQGNGQFTNGSIGISWSWAW